MFFKFSLIQKNNDTERSLYAYWRFRTMFFLMLAYAAFYFVRQNLSFAVPEMCQSLNLSKVALGQITTIFGIIYGFGKVISGIFGDNNSARAFLAVGLFLSALVNIVMGCVSSLWLMVIIWALNSCFQSTGAPACAKILAHWYNPKEFGVKWAIWTASQQIGSALIGVAIACFLPYLGWRFAFYIPGLLCLIISFFVFVGLRNDPAQLSLPSPEEYAKVERSPLEDECASMSSFEILTKRVLRNKMVWAIGAANFFTYFVKMSVFNWAPMFLCEAKGNSLVSAGYQTAIFNLAGIAGAIAIGVLSDRVFRGYRGRTGFFFMMGLSVAVCALWLVPEGMLFIYTPIMSAIGFFVVGPQTVVGVAAVDFSSKKAAGSATGLVGTMGYMGASSAGMGTAYVAEVFGWNGVFILLLVSSMLGCLCFLTTWHSRSKAFTEPAVKKVKAA
jgi:sugar phosphate permease